MKTLVGLVNEDLAAAQDNSLKTKSQPAVVDPALVKQIKDLLSSFEKTPLNRRLVTSGMGVLRYYACHEEDAHPLLTTPEAVRILWDTMQLHFEENDCLEDFVTILMCLTEKAEERASMQQGLPLYGIQLLAKCRHRVDKGSRAHRALSVLIKRMG